MIVAMNTKKGTVLNMMKKRFKMKDLGAVKWCLGMLVTRDRETRHVFLSQETYIGKMLRAFKMDGSDVREVDTPGSTSKRMSRADCAQEGTKEPWPYRALVGSLLYACTTRPDIQYMVGVLCRYCRAPGLPHWTAAKRVLRYLKGTRKIQLKLGGKRPV